ncbi:MAG: N-acetylglutaminylglutamine synthetase [Gammaproteobacteria bacterium]|nr:N-acetylglutaminylglutamine synthetase [Gammaproteobacteria bacterium]
MRSRMERRNSATLLLLDPGEREPRAHGHPARNIAIRCGWGRLIFGHTYPDARELAETLRGETDNERDLVLYLRDPHVVLSHAPQELFLDPSHTYRLWMSNYLPGRCLPRGFVVRRLQRRTDAETINRILRTHAMAPMDAEFVWEHRDSGMFTYLVAEDPQSGEIIGTVTGVDHERAFDDPENGASLWCLAVDRQASYPGVGRALVTSLADHFAARGRAFLDLSVMHDNREAIRLYEDLGFVRVPVFCIKKKNSINEPLYIGPDIGADLNPYAQIIVDEARRRGIAVEVIDAPRGYFSLTLGGRSIVCRESLSEATSAIAMSRCQDKAVTLDLCRAGGLRVPAQQPAGAAAENRAFLAAHGRIVVKPVDGEQGRGIGLDIRTAEELEAAIRAAQRFSQNIVLEEQVEGTDLRIVVIDYQVVAAAVRRPPRVTGNGDDTVRMLITALSRRRQAATRGESRIPIDEETERCVSRGGYDLDDVLPVGKSIQVRATANLHTGGTIHDVTADLGPQLAAVAVRAARIIGIPVTGLDLLVADPGGTDYVLIEANERPGLANHEPQPTAEKFIDFLFPQSRRP